MGSPPPLAAASPTTDPATAEQRRQWRSEALAARLALPAEIVAAHSAAIAEHLRQHLPPCLQRHHRLWPGLHIAFCWPIQHEPDLRPLLTDWLHQGVTPCLPVVTAPAQPLAFRPWTPATVLEPDRYGIPTPVSGPYVTPAVLLLPCNAFDAAGYRLGYGGGFFDRTLAALPAALAIGVAYAQAELPSTLPGPHDLPLQAIVTEQGWRDCAVD